jgi:hypothetical protein
MCPHTTIYVSSYYYMQVWKHHAEGSKVDMTRGGVQGGGNDGGGGGEGGGGEGSGTIEAGSAARCVRGAA